MKAVFMTVIATLFSSLTLNAQHPEAKRANRWYFGNGAGLDFSSGTAVAITDGKLDSWESCASICDIDGNLLFYTDGDTVWDRNHNVMPNGTGLYGDCLANVNNSATQGVIIIPQPKSQNLFYVFTVDCAENLGAKGMNYSIVNMGLNSGFGDVSLKNQFLFGPSTEGMAATMNCTRDSVWVVGHELGTDAFYAYSVTKNGLHTTPVISKIGWNVIAGIYPIRFSPNGKKIAHYVGLFDFDFGTGNIINEIEINLVTGYGISFSADSKMLYSSISGNFITQLDVSFNNQADIMNSLEVIYQGTSNNEYRGIRLGNDNRIYIAANDSLRITTIDNPNLTGSQSGFNPYSIDLNGKKCQFTFPSFIESYFHENYTVDSCSIPETLNTNVFTPNGDQVNDEFIIDGLMEGASITIYNRWGLMVYEGSAQDGKVKWNGHDGLNSKCSPGIYFYTVNNSKLEPKRGSIHLFY